MICGLTIVLVLVFVIGKANVINCQKVQNLIHGINDDRLVVMGFVVDLYSAVHQKELAAVTGDTDFYKNTNDTLNDNIRVLIEKFQATTLTVEERKVLRRFYSKMDDLFAAESALDLTEEILQTNKLQLLRTKISALKPDLQTLSRIQTDEGNRQLELSVRASEGMTWASGLSKYTAIIIILIMIGVVIIQPGKFPGSID